MNGVLAAFLLRFIVGIDWSALTLMIGLWEWHPACKKFSLKQTSPMVF